MIETGLKINVNIDDLETISSNHSNHTEPQVPLWAFCLLGIILIIVLVYKYY